MLFGGTTKVWIISAIMEEWLISLNTWMARKNRRMLLFSDNAACCPRIKFSNVKTHFPSLNMTSHMQPMYQRVIFTFKSHFHRLLLQSLFPRVSINELAKEISLLDAIQWTLTAMKRIHRSSIKKYFLKAVCSLKFHVKPNYRWLKNFVSKSWFWM